MDSQRFTQKKKHLKDWFVHNGGVRVRKCSGGFHSLTWTTCQSLWQVSQPRTPSAPPSFLPWGSASAPPRGRWWGWYWNKLDSCTSQCHMRSNKEKQAQGYRQGFCRFVLLRVRVLVLRILSLSSASCQKAASHQESRCVPISSVLQQVFHYKRRAQPQGMRKWLVQRWSCSLIHECCLQWPRSPTHHFLCREQRGTRPSTASRPCPHVSSGGPTCFWRLCRSLVSSSHLLEEEVPKGDSGKWLALKSADFFLWQFAFFSINSINNCTRNATRCWFCVLPQLLYLSFDVSADLAVVSGAFSQEAQHWSQALLVVGALLGAPQKRHVLDKLKGPVCVRHNNVKEC